MDVLTDDQLNEIRKGLEGARAVLAAGLGRDVLLPPVLWALDLLEDLDAARYELSQLQGRTDQLDNLLVYLYRHEIVDDVELEALGDPTVEDDADRAWWLAFFDRVALHWLAHRGIAPVHRVEGDGSFQRVLDEAAEGSDHWRPEGE